MGGGPACLAPVGHDVVVTGPARPTTDPLELVALETEKHVSGGGWDQGPRLFALVRTADVLAREPHLGAGLGPADLAPGALTAVEQEDLPATSTVESLLGQVAWPDTVTGCALAVERLVVPPGADEELPEDPESAAAALSAHPDRRDIRLVVAVLRDGSCRCLVRQRDHDSDDAVGSGDRLAPGLVDALLATLAD